MPTMCRVVEIPSKKPGGTNATMAQPVRPSTATAALRCQGRPRRRSSPSSAIPAISSQAGSSAYRPSLPRQLAHQPGDDDDPGLEGTLLVARARRVVAQLGDPEDLGLDGCVLGDAPDAVRVGEQETGHVGVGQLGLVGDVQRAVAHRLPVPVVGPGVPGPASRQPERLQVGVHVVLAGDDVLEDRVHGLDVVQPLSVVAARVPDGVSAGHERQDARDRRRRGDRAGAQPLPPGLAAAVAGHAGRDDGRADGHGQDQVLLLGHDGQDAAGAGQHQARHGLAVAAAEVHQARGEQQEPDHHGGLLERAGEHVEDRRVGHDHPDARGQEQLRPQPDPQAGDQAGDADRGQRAHQDAERDQVELAGQAEHRGQQPGDDQRGHLRGRVGQVVVAFRAHAVPEVGEAEEARVVMVVHRPHVQREAAHDSRAVPVVGLADRHRDEQPDQERGQRQAEDRQPADGHPRRPRDAQPADPQQDGRALRSLRSRWDLRGAAGASGAAGSLAVSSPDTPPVLSWPGRDEAPPPRARAPRQRIRKVGEINRQKRCIRTERAFSQKRSLIVT